MRSLRRLALHDNLKRPCTTTGSSPKEPTVHSILGCLSLQGLLGLSKVGPTNFILDLGIVHASRAVSIPWSRLQECFVPGPPTKRIGYQKNLRAFRTWAPGKLSGSASLTVGLSVLVRATQKACISTRSRSKSLLLMVAESQDQPLSLGFWQRPLLGFRRGGL